MAAAAATVVLVRSAASLAAEAERLDLALEWMGMESLEALGLARTAVSMAAAWPAKEAVVDLVAVSQAARAVLALGHRAAHQAEMAP